MAVGDVMFARATDHSGVSALIGTRCYPLMLPQRPTLPAMTYQVISRVQRESEPCVQQIRVQVDSWAATYAGAQALAAAVRAAYDAWRSLSGDTKIVWMQQVNEQDLYEAAPEMWRVSTDFLAQVVEE